MTYGVKLRMMLSIVVHILIYGTELCMLNSRGRRAEEVFDMKG